VPIYRLTFGFSGQAQGWSETLAIKSASLNPNDLKPTARNIAQKRVTFLGREFEINAVRISRYSNDGGTVRQRGTSIVKEVFSNPVNTIAQAAEPADVALIANGFPAANLGAPDAKLGNKNQLFLGAPPDPPVDNAGVVDLGKSNLGANYGQWRDLVLASSCGWLSGNVIAEFDIATVTQATTGQVIITSSGDLPNTLVLGRTYTSRIRRVNAGVSPLNGQVLLKVTGPRTVETQEVIGIALAQAGGSVKCYSIINQFLQFATLELQLIVGNHKRGRPFGSPRGRAPRRIRG
jgi:hypothetical protein